MTQERTDQRGLTARDLASMGGHTSTEHGPELWFDSPCHPAARIGACYRKRQRLLILTCGSCGKFVAAVAVADQAAPDFAAGAGYASMIEISLPPPPLEIWPENNTPDERRKAALASYRAGLRCHAIKATDNAEPAYAAIMAQVTFSFIDTRKRTGDILAEPLKAIFDALVQATVITPESNLVILPIEQRQAETDGVLLRIWPCDPNGPPPLYRGFAAQLVAIADRAMKGVEAGEIAHTKTLAPSTRLERLLGATDVLYPRDIWPADTTEPGGIQAWAIRDEIDRRLREMR